MLKINYDRKFDILYLSIGEPRPSYGEEETPGLVVLKDIETDEITGFTIFDFKKRVDTDSLNELNLPCKIDFKQLESLELN
ncbi:DUF2283 domain-containing protein [Thermotalea metallivorans]|uniref:DUF2283 domain-containing protein n=1 Tax=Thermotalea metallivorans TaxID=520762 RepID=A0A140LCN2_9FIRM|nr:DUF2283 domain-containing protein [Thermotalea metallivorans]KXG78307.1 hypothetical protein AN619_02820 [Thermotalea metallivorans]